MKKIYSIGLGMAVMLFLSAAVYAQFPKIQPMEVWRPETSLVTGEEIKKIEETSAEPKKKTQLLKKKKKSKVKKKSSRSRLVL